MSLQPPEPNSANDTEHVKLWSCVNCRRRKVRCDRRHPCAPCARNKTECIFPVFGRLPRRVRDAINPGAQKKQTELLGRLRRLEAMVGDLGSQVEHAAVIGQGNYPVETSTGVKSATSATSGETGQPDRRLAFLDQSTNASSWITRDVVQSGSSTTKGILGSPQVSEESGHLAVDSNGDLIVGDRFWTVFCKEVEQIFEAVHGPTIPHFGGDSSSSTTPESGDRRHEGFYNFLIKNTSATYPQEDLHPLPSQMLFLWRIYVDNVDPFIKLLHVPTMEKVFRELRGKYHTLSPSMHALVLVISLAAVMSLEDEEVHVSFNTDKNQLIARYRRGTEQALEQADFLNHPDMIVLQALTVYLSILQHTGETRSAWLLAGVLVRISASMKLHRDGSHFADITPFEVEMRRRLWWQICFIDSRSEDVQVSQFKISEGMFDTDIPTNTNDVNLDPEISKPPTVAESWTDMTPFLIHCEVWKLSRRLQSISAADHALSPDIDERLDIFQRSQARIEETYLKHLDPNQSLHSFVATSTRLFLTKIDLILHTKEHPARAVESQSANTQQSDKVFTCSLSIIEYTYALQNEPGWSGWAWQIKGRQPSWHALRVVLAHLCTHGWDQISERAWSSSKRSFDSIPATARIDPRYQQLSMMVTAVRRNRPDETAGESRNPHTDRTHTTASNLPTPLPQVGISEAASTWTPQEPLFGMTDGPNNNVLSDDLSLEMDWQPWDEIARELVPSLEFWDIGGL